MLVAAPALDDGVTEGALDGIGGFPDPKIGTFCSLEFALFLFFDPGMFTSWVGFAELDFVGSESGSWEVPGSPVSKTVKFEETRMFDLDGGDADTFGPSP